MLKSVPETNQYLAMKAMFLAEGNNRDCYKVWIHIWHTQTTEPFLVHWNLYNNNWKVVLNMSKDLVYVSCCLSCCRSLYIAGFPTEMYSRQKVSNLITSRKGFRGCLASVDLSGSVPDLITYARGNSNILAGCTGRW